MTLNRHAEPSRGKKRSPETRAKLAEAARKQWANPEARAKLAEAARKRLASPEARAKLAEAARKRWSGTVQVPKHLRGYAAKLRRCGITGEAFREAIDQEIRAGGSK